MAEGGVVLNLNTECDHPRQELEMERYPIRVDVDGMGSSAVAKAPKPVHNGLELKEAHLKDGKESLPTSNLSEDFTTYCKEVEERLINLNKTYAIFSEAEIKLLDETGRQLREKQILISFVGHLNVGKSTLLNALLGARLLPIKRAAETSIRVHIHHGAGDPKATSDQHPKLILEKGKQFPPEEVVGVTEIYKKLETLNKHVREGAEGHEEVCTLTTNVPLLTNTPPDWKMVLVDTPGTGEFNSRVAVAAEGAVKSSSAYVFITTYGELESAENANFIRFLHEHDQGVLEGRRLIIVVTKFDQTYQPTALEITVQEVQEKVQKLVSEACPDAKISCDVGLPLSGLWAYYARMLMNHPDGPEHDDYRKCVEWYLSQYQSLPCGQGESRSSCLIGKSDNELAKRLLDASGFASLEASIHDVTKSCIKVWVSKMKGDYERYLKQAKDRLSIQSESEVEQQKEQKEQHSQVQECLGVIDDERHDLEQMMKFKLYADLRKMYPQNQEVSETLQVGRQMVLDGIKGFYKECNKKVRDGRVTFGQKQFEESATAFLEKMSIGLEQISTHASWFKQLNHVLTVRSTEMGASIQRITENVQQLCTIPGQNTFEEIAVEANEEEDSSVPCIAPKLELLKETLNFPPAKVHWWTPLVDIFKKLISKLRALLDPDESPSCRFRSKEQEATMDQFEEQLQTECDTYFDNIKVHILKYFHDQYCLETRDRLKVLDGESKPKIDGGRRRLQRLNESLESTNRKINELQQLCEDLEKLTSDLHTTADDYIKH